MRRLLIVDDNTDFCLMLGRSLSRQYDVLVAFRRNEAIAAIGRHAPDLAIIDQRLPDGSGTDIAEFLRSQSPHSRCLIMTAYCIDGISGFASLQKPFEMHKLLQRLAALERGIRFQARAIEGGNDRLR